VFLEIAIVILALLVMRLATRVLTAPPLKLAKNGCLTRFRISSSGNTRADGGLASAVLTALAAMLWTAPPSASAAWPQSAPIKTLDSARQNRAQVSAGGRSSSEPPSSLDPLLAEARALADEGMASEAESRVRQYLAGHADSANAHFLLGYILFREIQEQAALSEKASLSDSAPTDVNGSAARPSSATASLDKGATSEANDRNTKTRASLAEFTEGAKYHTPGAFDLKIVAFDYVLLNDYMDADKWLTKMLQWSPDDAEGWYYLGRTKYNENRFNEAVHAFEQSLTLGPHNVKAEDNMGLAFAGLGRVDDAAGAYENAIAWQKNAATKNPGPYIDMGSLLLDQNRTTEAIPYLKQAILISPPDFKAHELLGKAYSRLDQLPEAQNELEQAIALAPQNPNLPCMLGPLYRKQGLIDQAKVQLDRCAAMSGTHSLPETPRP
jgi:tetratricopeptide (TPR) repeat protein